MSMRSPLPRIQATQWQPKLLRCQSFPHRSRRRLSCIISCAIRARWCIDVRYGVKLEAVALLQEWVRDLGSVAGLTSTNTALHSGSVGVPESRLELEVEFQTLAELEVFWASIPTEQHKAWSQRMQHYILDGSPAWHIYRSVPSFPPTDAEQQEIAASEPDGEGTRIIWPGLTQEQPTASPSLPAELPVQVQHKKKPRTAAEILAQLEDGQDINVGGPGSQTWSPDAHVVLDWKGDPMKVNPGDSLPGV